MPALLSGGKCGEIISRRRIGLRDRLVVEPCVRIDDDVAGEPLLAVVPDGGPIDPGSEAHDLVMSLFGGLSKAERRRIQHRTFCGPAAMFSLPLVERHAVARLDRFK